MRNPPISQLTFLSCLSICFGGGILGGHARESKHNVLNTQQSNDLRYLTLTRLESMLQLLVKRHGARMTLGEMLAVYAGMSRLCKQDRVTLAEIAEATGLPKQNISRWAQKRIGSSVGLIVNEDDQRVRDLVMLDRERGQENIERLAQILGTMEVS